MAMIRAGAIDCVCSSLSVGNCMQFAFRRAVGKGAEAAAEDDDQSRDGAGSTRSVRYGSTMISLCTCIAVAVIFCPDGWLMQCTHDCCRVVIQFFD